MKRNKKRTRRRFPDRDFRAYFRDEGAPSDEERGLRFDTDRIGFDHDWWREDLAARATRRERLRRRDLRKGLLEDSGGGRRSFDTRAERIPWDEEGPSALDELGP